MRLNILERSQDNSRYHLRLQAEVTIRNFGVGLFALITVAAAGLMLAVVLTYGWLVWGALGSVMDSLLNLVSAVLFGLAAGPIIDRFLQTIQQTDPSVGRNAILGGAILF